MLFRVVCGAYPEIQLSWFRKVGCDGATEEAFRDRIQPALWPRVLIVVTVTALASPYKYLLRGLAVVAVAVGVELLIRRVRHRWADSTDEQHIRRRQTLAGWKGLSVVYLGAAALAFQFMHSLDAPWVSAQAFLLNTPGTSTAARSCPI